MDERLIRLVTIITPPAPRNSLSLANNVYKWFMKDQKRGFRIVYSKNFGRCDTATAYCCFYQRFDVTKVCETKTLNKEKQNILKFCDQSFSFSIK